MIIGKRLPRRTFLRGLGAAVALPMLDAMVPALARSATSAPARAAFVYFPNGVMMDAWRPETEGSVADLPARLPRVLEPLDAYRDDVSVVAGLTCDGGRAHGDGPGDHGRAGASYLTSAHPRKTFGKDIQAGVSVDQVAAEAIGGDTPFASLELGCEEGIQGGNCDNGYSCAYSNSISWRTPSTPNPPEVLPRSVFERLFGADGFEQDPTLRARQRKYKQSVLDSVLEDVRRLEGTLGASDKRKIDEYLYSLRDIEKRIQLAEQGNDGQAQIDLDRPPSSAPGDFSVYSRLMFDLMTAAFQTDKTRVVTFLMSIEQSNRAYREIGIPDGHHGLTHHGGDPEKIEKCIQINRYQMEQFAYFIEKLKTTPDGDGMLIDNVMTTYGSGLSTEHYHDNLPTVIAGGRFTGFEYGKHYAYPVETPIANLHLRMLHGLGVEREAFADSTAVLEAI